MIIVPICIYCKHLRTTSNTAERNCNAFPKGIADDIWKAESDHKEPREGDNGIQFEAEDEDCARWARVWRREEDL